MTTQTAGARTVETFFEAHHDATLSRPDDRQALAVEIDDAIAAQVTAHVDVFAHDLRNALNAAMLSFDLIKSGRVEVSSSTGAMLGRSLLRLRDMIDHAQEESHGAARVESEPSAGSPR